jgi:hypothetical protein
MLAATRRGLTHDGNGTTAYGFNLSEDRAGLVAYLAEHKSQTQ